MAFKMSEGSLFAVLLRSPWWYSALLGLLLVVASLAVPNAQIAIVIFSLSLPFFGIAAFAAFKQSKQPSRKRMLEVDTQARGMTAAEIAAKIAHPYEEARFDSEKHATNVAELELIRGNQTLLLSTKRFKAATTGVEPLKMLVAAGKKVDATGYLYVTLGEVSDNARKFANENNIELIRAGRLAEFFDGSAQIS